MTIFRKLTINQIDFFKHHGRVAFRCQNLWCKNPPTHYYLYFDCETFMCNRCLKKKRKEERIRANYCPPSQEYSQGVKCFDFGIGSGGLKGHGD